VNGAPCAVGWAGERAGAVAVVASSFGAVSTMLSLPELGYRLSGVVLWQPVLDLRATFLEPTLPRGRVLYGDRTALHHTGVLDIEGRFELGAAPFEEFSRLDPRAAFTGDTGARCPRWSCTGTPTSTSATTSRGRLPRCARTRRGAVSRARATGFASRGPPSGW